MRTIRASLAAAAILGLLLALAARGSAGAQTYPPPVGSLSSGASPTTPSVGGTTTLTATVLDNAGSPVTGAQVLFQIASQPGTDAKFADGLTQTTAVTGANGIATVVLSVGSTTGTIIVKMVSDEKASQVTLQVQPTGIPTTGGPLSREEGGGLTSWQAALIAAGVVILLSLGVIAVRRRRA